MQATLMLEFVFFHFFSPTKIRCSFICICSFLRYTHNFDLVFINTNRNHIYFLGFWNGVILLTTGASAGLDIYKQEWGCTHLTPDLDGNVKKIREKHKLLVGMKDRINLMWVPGKWVSFSSNPK